MMVRRRKSCFVCCASTGQTITSKTYLASSPEEASSLFKKEVGIEPSNIEGPFYEKRKIKPKGSNKPSKTELSFSGEVRKGHYKNYLVNAFMLSSTEDYAYIIILKTLTEEQKKPKKGTFIVPLTDINFI